MSDKTNPGPVVTEEYTFRLEQHAHSWNLLVETKDGQVGVAAFGPIESLPVVLGILNLSGAKPKRVNPLFVVGKDHNGLS